MKQIALYYELREKRLKLQREADELEQQEKDILYSLTADLKPGQTYTGIDSGFTYKATSKVIPISQDWVKTLDFIQKTGSIDLLQKRLTESAVILRWDSGVDIPGVGRSDRWSVKVTKE